MILKIKNAQNANLTEDLGNVAAHRETVAAQLQALVENLQESEERSR
jgi:hypothetical protein